jgi:hypothetical protein
MENAPLLKKDKDVRFDEIVRKASPSDTRCQAIDFGLGGSGIFTRSSA